MFYISWVCLPRLLEIVVVLLCCNRVIYGFATWTRPRSIHHVPTACSHVFGFTACILPSRGRPYPDIREPGLYQAHVYAANHASDMCQRQRLYRAIARMQRQCHVEKVKNSEFHLACTSPMFPKVANLAVKVVRSSPCRGIRVCASTMPDKKTASEILWLHSRRIQHYPLYLPSLPPPTAPLPASPCRLVGASLVVKRMHRD